MRIGQYEILSQISEGSFGRTFRAKHALLDKFACVKQEKTGNPEYKKLFKREAELLWDLTHISLPVIREYCESSDFGQLMILKFLPGEDLLKAVVKNFIDDEHICWILQRLLDALSYLHYRRIIHSDIKPQNILLDVPEHNATLIDFGLCVEKPDGRTLPKGGTEFFLPPEFLQGLPPIPQSDIYSLGMTAICIAGGNIQNGSLPADMHPKLKEFIGCMIRRDPMARPGDAGKLNAELSRLRLEIFGRTTTREQFKYREVRV